MNEFEQKDYELARQYADSIKSDADAIMGIFDDVDYNMKILYGDAWQSSGADTANSRYQEIRRNYEVFYNRVIAMHEHVHKVTDINQQTDAAVSGMIAGN